MTFEPCVGVAYRPGPPADVRTDPIDRVNMAIRSWEFELQDFIIQGAKAVADEPLGNGAFGKVVRVTIPSRAKCAAKMIHGILFSEGGAAVREKFVSECKLMSRLRHPNIVQFLGICYLSGSEFPAIVMEELDTNLDEVLEQTSLENFPMIFKCSILHDVASGLAFLHSQQILHRDLTATNVLLNAAMEAKLADFGMARIVTICPGSKLTAVPGNLLYMPPEAFSDAEKTEYTGKLDVFSYGILTLFTLTQDYPKNLLPHTFTNPKTGKLVARSELERREQYMQKLYVLIGKDNPLSGLISNCLANIPDSRPTIDDILDVLEVQIQVCGTPMRRSRLEMEQAIKQLQSEIEHFRAVKEREEDLIREYAKKTDRLELDIKDLKERKHEEGLLIEVLIEENKVLKTQIKEQIEQIKEVETAYEGYDIISNANGTGTGTGTGDARQAATLPRMGQSLERESPTPETRKWSDRIAFILPTFQHRSNLKSTSTSSALDSSPALTSKAPVLSPVEVVTVFPKQSLMPECSNQFKSRSETSVATVDEVRVPKPSAVYVLPPVPLPRQRAASTDIHKKVDRTRSSPLVVDQEQPQESLTPCDVVTEQTSTERAPDSKPVVAKRRAPPVAPRPKPRNRTQSALS